MTYDRNEPPGGVNSPWGVLLKADRRQLTAGLSRLLVLLLSCSAGCLGQWRPSSEHVSQPAEARHSSQFDRCLAVNRLGRWVYERVELPEREGRPVRMHVRQVDVARLKEGVLEDRPFLRLDRYLDLKTPPTSRTADDPPVTQPAGEQNVPTRRPRAPLAGGTSIFFRLAESADPIPLRLETLAVVNSETPVTYYEYRGMPQVRGTLRRCSEFEGIEDVDCPAGRFEGCLRIRVDLKVRFPLVAIVDLTTYLWLSPEVGEVRRVQRLSGWFLIFPFVSADEYRLISFIPTAAATRAVSAPPPMWKTGAVLLEGDYPGIRIGGMVVDFEAPKAGQ